MLQANDQSQSVSSRNSNSADEALAEIADLIGGQILHGQFHDRVLEICQSQLQASAGCIWLTEGQRVGGGRVSGHGVADQQPRPQFTAAAESAGTLALLHPTAEQATRHSELLNAVFSGQRAVAVDSSSFVADSHQATYHLTLAPISTGQRATGVLELVSSRPVDSGSIQFLEAVSELVALYCDERRMVELESQNSELRKLNSYSELLQRQSDVHATCLTITNEARVLIGCDRLSIAMSAGTKQKISAVSGQEVLSNRSPAVQALETIANEVASKNQTLSYEVNASTPQSESVKRYLEHSTATTVKAMPLSAEQNHGIVDGVLIAEWFTDQQTTDRRITDPVVIHSALALRNALESDGQRFPKLFGRNAGRSGSRSAARSGLSWPWVAGGVLILAGFFFPVQFVVEGRGEIQPEVRRHVFASRDAVVSKLLIEDGATVNAQQPLLQLHDSKLDFELSQVVGEIQTATQKRESLNASLVVSGRSRQKLDAGAIAAEAEELTQYLRGLEKQKEILTSEQRKMTLRSPIAGTALTWNLKQRLDDRPVARGESLLTVADTKGPWLLDLLVSDDDFGPLRDATSDPNSSVQVSFRMSTHPGRSFTGNVRSIANATELDDIAGPVVRVTVSVNRNELPKLRPGTTVVAGIECGRQPMGYVWLHDIIDPIRSMFVF